MPLSDGKARVGDFFAAIEPWEKEYKQNGFAYVAVRDGDHFVITQGVLWLNTIESKIPFNYFETTNIRAGHFRLSDLNIEYPAFIDQILTGKIKTPNGDLEFPPIRGEHSMFYNPVHPSAQQSRVSVLRLGGREQTVQQNQPVVDWELRGASVPYDNLSELMVEYGLGGLYQDVISIEVIATSILGFDQLSAVSGTTATVIVRCASSLVKSKISVGYRVFSKGRVVVRSIIHGGEMKWTQLGDLQIGTATIQVPAAAVVHCYGNYAGVTQSHWWIADPSTSQNPRRTVYETFDNELAVLKDFITKADGRSRNARDLEAGVAWLLWMLGFSAAHLGGTGKTQDAADLVVVSPSGQYAVVECTTGLLRTDNKLPLLIARAEAVRRRLDASNQSHLKVLPVIVTSKAREEVRADVEQAERLGVLVVTQETLEQLVTRSLIAPNADAIFSESEKAIQDALAKYTPTPSQNNGS